MAGEPTYTSGGNTGERWAHFGSDGVVRVSVGRARSYPGLASVAPRTRAYYAALCDVAPDAERVVDVGCGSGEGVRCLADRYPDVVGIDWSAEALDFARAYEPRSQYLQSDLSAPPPIDDAHAVVIADVLGHCIVPEQMLRSVRQRVSEDARMMVAEPRAYGSQRLQAPARRAFSKPALTSLLAISGFEPLAWAKVEGSFSACVAAPSADEGWQWIVEAEASAAELDLERTLDALGRAGRSRSVPVQLQASLFEAEIHLARRDGDAAGRALFRAREIDATDGRALGGLARLALDSGSASDALELVSMAAKLAPTDFDVACTVARVVQQSSPVDALAAWRLAHALSPADSEAAVELARVASQIGAFETGVRALERLKEYVLHLEPDAHALLCDLLPLCGRPNDAELEARLRPDLAVAS